MALLKDSLITGDLRVTGTIYGDVPLNDLVDADDLKAIEALSGTSGLLKKTGANTWTLDTAAYTTSSGVTSVRVQATSPVVSSVNTAQTSTLNTTISLADGYGDTKNPYASKTARYVLAAPASAAGAPTFRALTNADVGLGNVENTKLSTWTGSSNITTIGTLSSGTVPWARLSNVPSANTSTAGIIQIGTGANNAAAGNHNHDSVYVNVTGDTMSGSLTISKAGECGLEVNNTQATNPNQVAFIVGASGNGGIYSRKHSKWIVYSDASGNVVLNGNANSATGFASAKTIALTGNVTGSATGGNGANGWSIATTIGSGVVTNAMLAGSIANGKLVNSKVTIANNDVSLGGSLSAATLKTSLGLNSAMHYIGKATVAITDGSTTDPKIGGNATTLVSGDVIIDSSDSREYVWNGSKWELLGGDSSYALSDHTHTTSLSQTGTATINLAANTAYTLTAGGTSVVFKTPADNNTNYYHTTGSWSGLTYTATANGGAGALAFTIPTGTSATTVAVGNHTHNNIVTVGDQRGTATTPNSYSNNIIFQGLKTNSSFGSPSTDNYSYVIGLRGWSDSSGGNSHELAFNNTGIFWRSGATTTWGNWYRIYTTANKPTAADVGAAAASHTHDDRYYTETEINTKLKKYVPSFINYRNTNGNNSGKYYKIAINSYVGWMINFTVKLYHSYQAYDIQISGYNYGSNHWYLPKAVLLGTTQTDSINVIFGYDSAYHLWVAIPAEQYTGISICGVTNGYSEITNFEDLFTITMVDAEPTTKQTTVTARKPLYIDEMGTLATKSTIANHSVTTPTGATSRTADVALNTTTVNSITAVGTLPSLTVTATNVVTGGTTTAIPNISKKTVVTGVTKKTVVTGGSTTAVPNISKKTVVTSATAAKATYSSGILTISDGSVTTGDSVTVGTAINAYTSLTTGDSVTVTTGDSVTVGTAINAYTTLTTSSIGSASGWSAGTLPTKGSNTTVATTVKTQPTFTVTTQTTTLSHTVS